jgi:hypothetical protein
MRSPHAARSSAKLLIFLVLGALPQISVGEAATKCPRGEILRVSKGVCVPKAENVELVRHATKQPNPPATEKNPLPVSEVSPNVTSVERSDPATSVALAEREAPAPAEQSEPSLASRAKSALSPFGQLFVGAFHSTVSSGLSAFR